MKSPFFLGASIADSEGLTPSDYALLSGMKIGWPKSATPAIYQFTECELADLREHGIYIESDEEFLSKRSIQPFDTSEIEKTLERRRLLTNPFDVGQGRF